MSRNINDLGQFIVIKTRLTTRGKRSVKKEEVIYMLPEASRSKAGQIGLAFPWHKGGSACVQRYGLKARQSGQ
jgi:hypothetical protein